jgi:hypothetical protein
MGWAQRLKRVFGIEMQRCEHCGGAVKIIASSEDPQVIERILAQVEPERMGQRLRAAAARGAAVGHERGIRVSPRNAARRRPRLGVEGSARTRISR